MTIPTICITFEISNQEEKDILIAMLSHIGFDAFEEEGMTLKSYIQEDKLNTTDFEDIIKLFKINYSLSVIPVTNWNEKWETAFMPVTVPLQESNEIFVNIRAHFHPALQNAKYEIIITPKMSFGTGHHATTYGMIECMCKLDFSGKDLIDFGTGTGVLAILAEKMGALHILAIDNDEWSISNAAENIKKNGCSNIRLLKAESISTTFKADIILANINLNVILPNLEMLKKACKKGASIILSGMLCEDKPLITSALKEHSICIKEIYEKDNWIVVQAGYPK